MRGQSPASSGPQVTRLSALIRETRDRVKRLENRRIATIQQTWRIDTDSDGNLIAIHVSTGTVRVLAAVPLPLEED